jgi:uncharacterized protein (TIGR01777 family)
MSSRIVICGGSGFIGSALRSQLKTAGYDVIIVSRQPKDGEIGWSQLAHSLEGAKAVINLSGRSIACKFSEANKREIRSSRIESAKQVADAIAQTEVKPEKWINASATGFYGNRGQEILTESSTRGSNFSSEVCVAWEDACLKAPVDIPKVVIRIGIVLSSHGGVLSKLVPLTKAFLGGTAGNGDQWISWIHLTDIVRIIVWTIKHDTPDIVSGSTHSPVQNRDFMTWLRRAYGRPWSPPVPAPLLNLVGKVVGPDASLVLDSYRVIPSTLSNFPFEFPTLSSISRSDL